MRTFAFVLVALLAGRAAAADGPSAVLAAGEFARVPGLEKAVNDPAFAERPVVEVDAQGKLRVRVQFKPFVLTDADGTRLELAAPDEWPTVYAALAQGKVAPVTLTLPVGGGNSIRARHALRGAPPAKAQVAYIRATVTDETGRTVAADTVAKLGAAADGLPALLAAPKFWTDDLPAVTEGALALRLRPLPGAVVGGFQWRFEWPAKGDGPLETALALNAGKKPAVTLALVPKDRPKEVAFRVAAALTEYPREPFAPARGVRVVYGKDTLHEAAGLDKLTDSELFWNAKYSLPPVVDGGTLVFGLKPYDFRDVRSDPVAVTTPADGWLPFYRRVQAGEKVSLDVTPKGLNPLRDAVLPPPGKVLIAEPAVARVREDAPPFIALVTGDSPRVVPLIRLGDRLYWGERAEVGRPAHEHPMFFRVTPEGKPARWALAALTTDKNEPLPRAQGALRGADAWLKLPTEWPTQDGAKMRIEHQPPPEFGYAGGWSVELAAHKGKLALASGLPVDLRFARRVTVTTEKYSYTLTPPFPAGKPEVVADGSVDNVAVGWWAGQNLGPPDTDVEIVLVVDGSLPDRTRARERLSEWERWQGPLATVRKAEGKKLAVVVARNGDVSLPAGGKFGDPAGADPFLETSFPVALRNVLARHPGAKRVVVWPASGSLLEKPDRAWVGDHGPRVELIRATSEAKPDEVVELLKKAVQP